MSLTAIRRRPRSRLAPVEVASCGVSVALLTVSCALALCARLRERTVCCLCGESLARCCRCAGAFWSSTGAWLVIQGIGFGHCIIRRGLHCDWGAVIGIPPLPRPSVVGVFVRCAETTYTRRSSSRWLDLRLRRVRSATSGCDGRSRKFLRLYVRHRRTARISNVA